MSLTTMVIGDEPFVKDLRGDDDSSLSVIPRIYNYEELASWFNVSVDRSLGWDAAGPGDLVVKCVGFYLRSGVASFIARMNDQGGNPLGGYWAIHSWPGAPRLPSDPYPNYGLYGVAGEFNGSGDAGFPYSGGMVYTGSKPYSGPGEIWVLCPLHLPEPKYSDRVSGLGWVGGTDHLTVNPIFQLVRKGNEPGPEPPPDVEGGTFLRVVVNGQEVGIIPIIKRPSPQELNALELYVNHIFLGDIKF